MIQRIQTVWLFLAALVLLGLFQFPYVSYIDLVGLGRKIYVTGEYSAVNNETVKQSSHLLQTIVTIILVILPIVTIFMFKDRKRQLKMIFLTIGLIVVFMIWLLFSANGTLASISQTVGANNIGVGFFLLPVSIIFLAMAIGGIRKDEKLIKSADRLR